MAYDEDLANRIREQFAGETALTEQRMFGGLGFMLGGHMCVAARGGGGLLARVDPEASDAALAEPHASLMEMRGRQMRGWIVVAPEGVDSDEPLAGWIERSKAFVRTLPPKG
jgi:TfoX N-terminal domain